MNRDDLGGRIHVALDDMASKAALGPHRSLQINLAPIDSEPNEVRSSVSGLSSKVSVCAPETRGPMTVRQQPFTAMLSPTLIGSGQESTGAESVSRLSTSDSTSPIASTMPVNIREETRPGRPRYYLSPGSTIPRMITR